MRLTTCTIRTRVPCALTIVLASDLHGRDSENALALTEAARPDLILCPGDMMENIADFPCTAPRSSHGFRYLTEAASIAPLYYSLGNHELGLSADNRRLLEAEGVCILDNRAITLSCGVTIGGLTSGYINAIRETGKYRPSPPDLSFLNAFAASDGFKILLCHHPEYYIPHLRHLPLDLVLSGHAHGGQWRLFGRGLYAPGQGLFPKYTAGIHENRLCISRGMANTVVFPRFFNPRELVLLKILPEEDVS